jgi:hypothetical protein
MNAKAENMLMQIRNNIRIMKNKTTEENELR